MTDNGSDAAARYRRGRLPYPAALEQEVAQAVGTGGRLLDVGCGPGTLALRLAPLFDGTVGVDVDRSPLETAVAAAARQGLQGVRFVQAAAEDLPAGLGRFRVAASGMAFHWFDPVVAAGALADTVEPGGFCVLVYGWTLSGDAVPESDHPLPPYDELTALLPGGAHATPRAGPGDEAGPMTAAGFTGPREVTVPGGDVVTSTVADLVARTLSRSQAAAGRTGPAAARFAAQITAVLERATPTGHFAERLRPARLNIWTRPPEP